MGFLTNLVGAAVKVALTPVAVVVDVKDVTQGVKPENTKKLASSALDDTVDALDDLTNLDLF